VNTAWRHAPINKLLAGNTSSTVRARLRKAGYRTAGELLDATPGELADKIKGFGMARAIKLRQRVFDQIKPPAVQYIEIPASNTPWRDTLLGIIGTLAFLFIIWAAMVVLP
jgi:hypothetical protein